MLVVAARDVGAVAYKNSAGHFFELWRAASISSPGKTSRVKGKSPPW